MQFVPSSHDGATIAFQVAGSGNPQLLFVPGLTGDHTDFSAQTEYFNSQHLTVAVELPGNGRAGTNRTDWSMSTFAADIATVIEHLDLDSAVLVGHSLGGDAALEAAHLAKGRVIAVVMVSSYRTFDDHPSEERLSQWLAPFSADFPAAMEDLTRRNFGSNADQAMVDETVARMVKADPDMVIPVLRSKMGNEAFVVGTLENLTVPVFAVNPDFKANDESALKRNGVDLRVVKGVGHYTMMEAPEAFNRTLSDILAGLD